MEHRKDFKDLTTEKFRMRMRPHAERIYQRLFPGCTIQDLREDGVRVHVLDKEFGIDTLATFKSRQWISIQEKYRKHSFLRNKRNRVLPNCPDFTQEYKNATATEFESDGEWFHLGAQFYFYGWANIYQNDFEAWILLDIAKYKLLVERAGGLHHLGKLKYNRRHGSASFYAIPVIRLKDAIIRSHKTDDVALI